MLNKIILNDIEYHLSSRNMKALFTGKTEHLRHFDPHIVELEMDQGLKGYENKEAIRLPNPEILQMPLDEVMEKRRSRRDFKSYKITLKELSTLLFYSAGYKRSEHSGRKHVPSSGGFCTTEVFFVILNSDEVEPGLYYSRLYQKYRHRTLRLCLLDAGHVAQNLYLTCAAMDMKICEVLGYVENEVEEAFDLSGNTPTFSSIVIGR